MSRSRFLFTSALLAALVVGIVWWRAAERQLPSEVPLVFSSQGQSPRYGCASDSLVNLPKATRPGLTDVTQEVGLDFQHIVGPLGTYFMPESIGAGGAMFDADGDGRLDIYLLNCGASPWTGRELPVDTRTENRFFRQSEGGLFEDLTAESGLGDLGYAAGCAVGDFNNDGTPDLFVTNYGSDRLFLNRGDGRFVDTTSESGIEGLEWGTCTVAFDYDRDGRLDLLVVNYTSDPEHQHSIACGFSHGLVSYCGPHKFQPTIDRLFRNEGPVAASETDVKSIEERHDEPIRVRFRDVTSEAGLDQAMTYGFGAICADLTGDLWPDIFVANDGAANRFWVNQRDGTFREEAVERGLAFNKHGNAEAGMGVAMGDVNGDGLQDLLVTHLSTETSTLYVNSQAGYFSDRTKEADLEDVTRPRTGWGVALIDLNHDGHLDLPHVNGLVVPCRSGFPFHGEDQFQDRNDNINDAAGYWKEYADRNMLLMGIGTGGFSEDSEAGGDFVRDIASGRGLIYGDFDNDGDVDLLVSNCGGRARLYRNDLPKSGNWLRIRVVDHVSGRDALGSTVIVGTSERNLTQILAPQSSYLASHEPVLHFGLRPSESVESVIVYWPDGPIENAGEQFSRDRWQVNRLEAIRRGTGTPVALGRSSTERD